jgi:hypothetical protein
VMALRASLFPFRSVSLQTLPRLSSSIIVLLSLASRTKKTASPVSLSEARFLFWEISSCHVQRQSTLSSSDDSSSDKKVQSNLPS